MLVLGARQSAVLQGLWLHTDSHTQAACGVQVNRSDWSRNAGALTDMNWWKGTLKPRPAVDWYLTRINTALDELKRQVDGAPIALLGHSVCRELRPDQGTCTLLTCVMGVRGMDV